jgi:uncharacterized SAM-binding protein YcdF (DUF218 family)
MGPRPLRAEPALAASARPRRRTRWRRWAVLAAILAVLYLGRQTLLTRAARFLNVAEPPRPVDAVLVLGGHVESRPFGGAALYKAGLAKKVLVSVPRPSESAPPENVPAEEEVARRILLTRGVPAADVLSLGSECASTRDEAYALGRFLEDHPSWSVAVLTSTFHTRRARDIFRRVLGARADRLHFVAVPTEGYDETNWWHFEEGFTEYALEYAKWAWYVLGP